MTTNETVSIKEHVTALIEGTRELTKREFEHVNQRLDAMQIHLEARQGMVDHEFADMREEFNGRFEKIETRVDAINTTIVRWGAIIAVLSPLAGAVLFELAKHVIWG